MKLLWNYVYGNNMWDGIGEDEKEEEKISSGLDGKLLKVYEG